MEDRDRIFFAYLRRPTRRRLARVVRRFQDVVWESALRVTRDREDASDICQDVFLKLLLDPPDTASIRSPAGYLAWCAVGKATNLRRAERKRKDRETAGARAASDDGLSVDDLEALRAAILSLPEDLRAPIELRYLTGLRNTEIGNALGLSVRSVEERLQKGREALRRRIGASAGLLLFFERASECRTLSPPALLPALLRIARMGSALAAGNAAPPTAAILLKKIAIACLVLLLAGGGVVVVSSRRAPPLAPDTRAWAPRGAPDPAEPRGAAGREDQHPSGEAILASGSSASPPTSASLRGTVRDEEGRPIAGAKMTLTYGFSGPRKESERAAGVGERPLETMTGEAGEYSFTGLRPGMVYLVPEKEGLLLQWPGWAELTSGEVSGKDLILHFPHRLRGRVRAASGEPLEEVEVFGDASALDLARKMEMELMDEDGHLVTGYYTIPVDGDGAFDSGPSLIVWKSGGTAPLRVRALAKGYALREESIPHEDFQGGVAEIELVLEPGRSSMVRVTDPDGSPIEGAKVGPGTETGFLDGLLMARTDREGRAMIEHLSLESSGDRTLADGAKIDIAADSIRIDHDRYMPVSIKLGPEIRDEIPVILRPLGPSIEGNLTFDDSIPPHDRRIHPLSLERRTEEGTFAGHKPAKVKLDEKSLHFDFWPPDSGLYRLRWGGEGCGFDETMSEAFEFQGTRQVHVDLHVGLGPPIISGRVVRAATGEAIPGGAVHAEVGARSDSRRTWDVSEWINGFAFPMGRVGETHETSADATGRFVLRLPASAPPRSLLILRAGSQDTGWSEEAEIEFDAKTVVQDLTLEVLDGGSIEGRMTGEDGDPAADELVAAYDGRGILSRSLTDRDGRYRISHLPPGRYMVEALGPCPLPRNGYRTSSGAEADIPPPWEVLDRPVEVREGEASIRDIDLRKSRLGIIEGTVSDLLQESGGVFHGMLVGGLPRAFSCLGGRSEFTDRRFRIEKLLPGTYRIWLESGGGIAAEAETIVRRGSVTRVRLEPPCASLLVPVQGIDPRLLSLGFVDVEEAERCIVQNGRMVRERLGGFRQSAVEGGLRVEGLPAGPVRVRLHMHDRNMFDAWTEAIPLADGEEAKAPPVTLERGHAIRIRMEGAPPEKISFVVRTLPDGTPIDFGTARVPGQGVFELSPFSPGQISIEAKAEGFRSEPQIVTVPEEGEGEVHLRLEPVAR